MSPAAAPLVFIRADHGGVPDVIDIIEHPGDVEVANSGGDVADGALGHGGARGRLHTDKKRPPEALPQGRIVRPEEASCGIPA